MSGGLAGDHCFVLVSSTRSHSFLNPGASTPLLGGASGCGQPPGGSGAPSQGCGLWFPGSDAGGEMVWGYIYFGASGTGCNQPTDVDLSRPSLRRRIGTGGVGALSADSGVNRFAMFRLSRGPLYLRFYSSPSKIFPPIFWTPYFGHTLCFALLLISSELDA